jgi:predicted glycoside hydrolase/deacetylase ChbG (UPF0249 family)
MTHVVVNGDDLGIANGVNAAIDRAFRTGILTSASVMTNMPAFDDAVEKVIAPNPRLGVGIHLVLTSGVCVSEPSRVSLLVNGCGVFRHGFFGLKRLVSGAVALDQVERELRAQCEKALRAGIHIDHLDGHRHIHMIPEIWQVVVRLATDYGIPYVRLADERWSRALPRRAVTVVARNLAKKVVLSRFAHRNRAYLRQAVLPRRIRTADHIMGILDSDAIGPDNLGTFLSQASVGITEIIVHPGCDAHESQKLECASMDLRFLSSPNRRLELEALTNPAVATITARRGVHLTSFGALAADTPRAA